MNSASDRRTMFSLIYKSETELQVNLDMQIGQARAVRFDPQTMKPDECFCGHKLKAGDLVSEVRGIWHRFSCSDACRDEAVNWEGAPDPHDWN
jgi:hypothetical protein